MNSTRNHGDLPVRILVAGAYGGYNLGDEMILHCIKRQLGSGADVDALSGNPGHTRQMHGISSRWNIDPRRRRFQVNGLTAYDAIVIGGGEIFQESRYSNPFWGLLTSAYLLARQARRAGTPVFCWSIGVDALTSRISRRMAARVVSNSTHVSVRDQESRARLIQYGADESKISVCADPVLALGQMDKTEAIDRVGSLGLTPGQYIVCAPAIDARRSTRYDAIKLVEACQTVASANELKVVLLIMDQRASFEGQLTEDSSIFESPLPIVISEKSIADLEDLVALHRCARTVVASRMHSTILAATQYVPTLSVNRSAKMVANARQLGLVSVEQGDIDKNDVMALIEELVNLPLGSAVKSNRPTDEVGLSAKAAVALLWELIQ